VKKEWYHHFHRAHSGFHGNWCIDKWNIEETHYLFMEDILHLLTDDVIQSISLKDIAWKDKHLFPLPWPEDIDLRYEAADTKYPGIILSNAFNPFDNKYRMVDGRRRLVKMLLEHKTEGLFYVLDFKDVKQFFLKEDNDLVKERRNYEFSS